MDLVFDQEYLPALIKLLGSARKSIDIMAYSFAIGTASGRVNSKSTPYEIALKLKEIKESLGDKIRIRLYIEGLRDTSLRNKTTVKFLKDAGVEVTLGSTHAKGFCIDERRVLFGSTNLTHQSITKNTEANILFTNKKAATEFMKYFEYMWDGGHHGGIKLKAPFYADGDFLKEILKMISRAKKKIEFSMYFFNLRVIEEALIEAHSRGVKVKGFIHQHGSFALSYIRANQATYKRLKRGGVEDVHLSTYSVFYHSKYIVVDGIKFALGTGNWLKEDVDTHPQLYVSLKKTELAKKLSRHLNHQIKHLSYKPNQL